MTRFLFAALLGLGIVWISGSLDRSEGRSAPLEPEPIRAVIHINFADTDRHQGGLKNIRNVLKAVDGNAELEVVCHSGGIGLVVSGQTEYASDVEALLSQGVQFVACENTMREKSITRSDLIPGVGTVPAGAVEVIRKQHDGFAYFRP